MSGAPKMGLRPKAPYNFSREPLAPACIEVFAVFGRRYQSSFGLADLGLPA
jgi:hypothetical protein